MKNTWLLHASFQPENLARRIRNLTRHREKHLDEVSRVIQHMQKALEQMNIKNDWEDKPKLLAFLDQFGKGRH